VKIKSQAMYVEAYADYHRTRVRLPPPPPVFAWSEARSEDCRAGAVRRKRAIPLEI